MDIHFGRLHLYSYTGQTNRVYLFIIFDKRVSLYLNIIYGCITVLHLIYNFHFMTKQN